MTHLLEALADRVLMRDGGTGTSIHAFVLDAVEGPASSQRIIRGPDISRFERVAPNEPGKYTTP